MDRIRQKAPTFLELGANIGPCGKMTDDDADSGMAVIIHEAPGVEIGSEEGE